MKKVKGLVSTAILTLTLLCGQATFAMSSKGVDNSHEQFTKQSLKILQNDKGQAVSSFYNSYKNILLEYCVKPDKDETGYAFAYHFYDPNTNKNYLPSAVPASKTTALVKFKEHMKNAVNNYKTNKQLSMQELGRALHFLEDANVPHHAANLIGGVTSHSQYEKYIEKDETKYFVNTSKAYDKFSNYSFENYYIALFNECARYANSFKDKAKSYKEADWDVVARPTLKLCQEDMASLLYRFEKEVSR